MKRRDFLKATMLAGAAAAVPGSMMTLQSCSEDKKATTVAPNQLEGKADILVLGNIITIDPDQLFAEAMTIKNGLIQYVGPKTIAQTYCDDNTKVIDYGTNTVYPGFMEAHCHGSLAGQMLSGILLYDGKSYKEYQEIIKKYIDEHPDQEIYKMAGWKEVEVLPPTCKLLDEVCPDKPIIGSSFDGHSQLMNTKAKEKFGVDAEFAKKYGTDQVRVFEDGTPTGYISEAPAMAISKQLAATQEDAKRYIKDWEKFAFSHGYVAAAEAGVNLVPKNHEAYLELDAANELKIRTFSFYNIVQDDATPENVQMVADMKEATKNGRYKVVGVKLFIDGVVEGHTGLLAEDYVDAPGKGVNRYPDAEKLKMVVLEAHKHGLPTHTHSIGDAATTYMLDAIENSKKITGNYAIRDMLAHLQLVDPKDFKRFAKNNVSAIIAALWAPKEVNVIYRQEVQFIGKERADRSYQAATFLQWGINCAQHTDYPVSIDMNIPKAIYCAVTRMLPTDGEKSLREKNEAVSRLEILKEFTINVAYLWNEEKNMGTLTAGKQANYVVWDTDFIDDDIEKIPAAKLLNVVIDGEEVYKA